MENQQPTQQTIRIVLDDAIAQGEYVNFANIIHSPSEFILDLGRVVPGRSDVKIYSRVILTPLHAKQLLEALGHNIAHFEQKYGEIRAVAPNEYTEPSLHASATRTVLAAISRAPLRTIIARAS